MFLDTFKERVLQTKSIASKQIAGCTVAELAFLEQQLKLRLPQAYKEFLLWMGHQAGGFLQGSDCFYQSLLSLQTSAQDLLTENAFPQPLPPGAFVFFMHQGYQFNFFLTTTDEDPAVYRYYEGETTNSFEEIYSHFSDFLLTELEDHRRILADL